MRSRFWLGALDPAPPHIGALPADTVPPQYRGMITFIAAGIRCRNA